MLTLRNSLLVLVLFILSCSNIYASQVWLNSNTKVYHCPGTRWYANTKRGKFIDESTAITKGYRPSYGEYCNPKAAQAAKTKVKQSLSPKASSIKVWVNSKSRVYHCPGTRYFGKTKRGKFMTQEEALLSNNRPAYGDRCH